MTFRYERKFYINDFTFQEVEAVVKRHHHCFSEVFEPRQINNIYFDFYNLQNFHDNVEGLHIRKKHRVRWYGETFKDIKKPVLEIKMKNGLLGSKDNYPVNVFKLDKDFCPKTVDGIFDTPAIPGLLGQELKTLKPMLLNSYKRKYFLSADKNYRITIDSCLKYHKILNRNNSFIHRCHVDRSIILELKYEADMDEGVDDITNKLPFRVTKSSKYVEGIEKLYGVL